MSRISLGLLEMVGKYETQQNTQQRLVVFIQKRLHTAQVQSLKNVSSIKHISKLCFMCLHLWHNEKQAVTN